ncbi:hypothetical protein T265_12626, partial [Opisthorchis viverrini]
LKWCQTGFYILNYKYNTIHLTSKSKQVLQSSVGYTEGEASGRLLDYGVEMISVRGDTINKYADWNMKQGFVYTKESDELWASFRSQFENKTFIVTTIEDPPFVIYEPFRKGKHMEGKDQWTGFAMELLKHLSKMNHFDYVIKPVEDRKFGTFDETKGRWDGLIGELIYKRAETHCTAAELRKKEENHLFRVFQNNGYPRSFIKRNLKKTSQQQQEQEQATRRVALPYIKNISELATRLLAQKGIFVARKPSATPRKLICRPKDNRDKTKRNNVIYEINCNDRNKFYVEQTWRKLCTRIKEHNTAVRRHDPLSLISMHED